MIRHDLRLLTIALTAGIIAIAGCDNKPVNSWPAPPTRPSSTAPTTRSLVTLPLGSVMPLTVVVPGDWAVKPAKMDADDPQARPEIFLEGTVPVVISFPEISILLSHQRPITPAELANFIRGAAILAQQDPRRQMDTPRTVGKMTVVQERWLPTTRPSTRAVSTAGALPPLYRWTTTVFVEKHSHDYDQYILDFVGLDIDTYTANKAFLESIMNSITYDPKTDIDLSVEHPVRATVP